MAPLEFETYSQETKRWKRVKRVEVGKKRILFNFRPKDGKQEVILLQSGDSASTISAGELSEKSSVKPFGIGVIDIVPNSIKEIAKLEKDKPPFEMTIREYSERSIPIQYRFRHK